MIGHVPARDLSGAQKRDGVRTSDSDSRLGSGARKRDCNALVCSCVMKDTELEKLQNRLQSVWS